MGATQVYSDWGTAGEVPEETISWEEVKADIKDFEVSRWRWLGDHIGDGSVIIEQSYMYVRHINGTIYRCTGWPHTYFCGRRWDFKKWLYNALKHEKVFLKKAFDNQSLFV